MELNSMKYNVKAYQVVNRRFVFIGTFAEVEDLEWLRANLGGKDKKIRFRYDED